MRIVSWNVNGIRSVHRKGFLEFLASSSPDVLGLQETRASLLEVPQELQAPLGYEARYLAAERPGYSGTALFTKVRYSTYKTGLGVKRFDCEGRLQSLDLGEFVLFNVYFPNGSGVDRDNSRVPYKLSFYRRLFKEIGELRAAGREVVILGDFNTAHREIDVKNWRGNKTTSGFLPEERSELSRWLKSGLVDTFRHVHGDVQDAYSWWSVRKGVRERNVGWRIDYVLVTPGLLPRLRGAFLWPHVLGSDHCPVGIEIS